MDRIDQLKRLGELKASGALSQDEFDREKAAVLAESQQSTGGLRWPHYLSAVIVIVAVVAAFIFLCPRSVRQNNEVIARAAPTPAATPIAAPPTAEAVQADAPASSEIPQAVSALIATEERENDRCRGGSGDDPNTMRACNRRQEVLKQLQDSGWCWGGAEIEAEKHFVRCKPGDQDYSAGAFDKPDYSEADIAEATPAAASGSSAAH